MTYSQEVKQKRENFLLLLAKCDEHGDQKNDETEHTVATYHVIGNGPNRSRERKAQDYEAKRREEA